jgi:hypothetical protein
MWIAIGVPDHCDETQDRSDWWYDSIAAATGSIMVPSGHAWYYAYKERPELEYIDPGWNDGCHPGKFGAYLNVCCQYAALTGKSPVGSTWHKVWMGDTITLSDDEALFAQEKAWEAYVYFNAQTSARGSQVAAESRADFRATYSPVSRRITVPGHEVAGLHVLALDGARVATHRSGPATVSVASDVAAGVYVLKALCKGAWHATPVQIE